MKKYSTFDATNTTEEYLQFFFIQILKFFYNDGQHMAQKMGRKV
ncbi:protein of unknown function [Chryseobacterium sp. JV274]|nr:protein of unknown function [Chryseobacterium sp. JV274]